jgi:hypothetical protein
MVHKTYNCNLCRGFYNPEMHNTEKMDNLYGISIASNGNRQRCHHEDTEIHLCKDCIRGIIKLYAPFFEVDS